MKFHTTYRAAIRHAALGLMAAVAAFTLCPAHADPIGSIISYQGKLSQNNGQPVADGTQSITFTFYEEGTPMGTALTMNVATVGGVFNTFLSVGTLTFDPSKSYELGIKVGDGAEMKHPIAAVPVALNAKTATTATTATTAATADAVSAAAGDSVVAAINAGTSSIDTARVSGDVELAPAAQQTSSASRSLINIKMVDAVPMGVAGENALLSLSASGTYNDGNTHDKERFRVDNDGALLSVGEYNGGMPTRVPTEGAGTRFMWYPGKAALRAGAINGTQWDDANIGNYSTAFGENVRALGDNAIAVGKNTVAANTGTVALGEGNIATGVNSIALGYYASTSTASGAPRTGTFVFSDRSDTSSVFNAQVTNAAHWRVANGFRIFTSSNLSTGVTFQSGGTTSNWGQDNAVISTSTGAYLHSSGIWTNVSDRNKKTNFSAVDGREVLRKVAALPMTSWNYKSDPNALHIGPMAQDFHEAFKLGSDNKTIGTVDADGVALAAIQGLNEELKDRDARIKMLEAQNAAFEARLKKLEVGR